MLFLLLLPQVPYYFKEKMNWTEWILLALRKSNKKSISLLNKNQKSSQKVRCCSIEHNYGGFFFLLLVILWSFIPWNNLFFLSKAKSVMFFFSMLPNTNHLILHITFVCWWLIWSKHLYIISYIFMLIILCFDVFYIFP